MINFKGLTTELETLCRVPYPIPNLSSQTGSRSNIGSAGFSGFAEGNYAYDDIDRSVLRKHVFANVWERSLDPRGVGSDEQSPDTWTIDWRQWPPDVPRVPAGLKIPIEFIPNAEVSLLEAIPISSALPEYYESLKGLLNTSQTSSVTVHPPALLFLHSKMGQFYSVKLRVKNVDNVPRRVKMIPPRNTCFDVIWEAQNTTIVPGLSIPISVHFKPNSNQSINEILFIAVEGDGGITVPLISASEPPPILELEEWDCGCSVISTRRVEHFEIRNMGSSGRFWFLTEDEFRYEYIALQKDHYKAIMKSRISQVAPSEMKFPPLDNKSDNFTARKPRRDGNRGYSNPFKISPIGFQLHRNQKIRIKVKYSPKTAGLHYEKIAVLCDTGEVKWIAIKGIGIDPLSKSLIELQSGLHSWKGPPVDLAADINCRYVVDLGDLLPTDSGKVQFRAVNRSCVPLYFFWSVRPVQLETTTSTHMAFQNFLEASIQPTEWEDNFGVWHDGTEVMEDQVDVKISPAQGLLLQKKKVEFNLSSQSPLKLGYCACVVSLFVEQVDEESISTIIPFIKDLEDQGINNTPIHLDDLRQTMPPPKTHHHNHSSNNGHSNETSGSGESSSEPHSHKSHRSHGEKSVRGSQGEDYPSGSLESDSSDHIVHPPLYMVKHGSQGHDKIAKVKLNRHHHRLVHADQLLPDNSPNSDAEEQENANPKSSKAYEDRKSLYPKGEDNTKSSKAYEDRNSLFPKGEGDIKSSRAYEDRNSLFPKGEGDTRNTLKSGSPIRQSMFSEPEEETKRKSSGAQDSYENSPRESFDVNEDPDDAKSETDVKLPTTRRSMWIINDPELGPVDDQTEVSYILKPDDLHIPPGLNGYRRFSPTIEELKTYTNFSAVPRPTTWLPNSAMLPIVEVEVWLRSVPLQVQFHPPFLVATGTTKSKAVKVFHAYNASSWVVEVNWKGMMDSVCSVTCEPSSFILQPQQRFKFNMNVFFEAHGKVFKDFQGFMKISKSTIEVPCAISCSLTTSGPFIIPLTPILNFGIMKISSERMKTLAIKNTGDKKARWVASVNAEGLVDENYRNISPFNRNLEGLRLLRVWPTWGILEPQETLGVNVYLSAEVSGEIAASVKIMVEGVPESAIFIPICAEVQSPFLILEESEIVLSREALFMNKIADTTVTLVNPTGYPVTFMWQSCLIGRQSQLVKAEFYPKSGFVPPRGTMDCIITISSHADARLKNVYAMCIVDAMKEPLLLKISSE